MSTVFAKLQPILLIYGAVQTSNISFMEELFIVVVLYQTGMEIYIHISYY